MIREKKNVILKDIFKRFLNNNLIVSKARETTSILDIFICEKYSPIMFEGLRREESEIVDFVFNLLTFIY